MFAQVIRDIEAQLTVERARSIALVAVILFVGIAALKIWQLVVSLWGVDLTFGPDFPAFWSAAYLTVQGMAEAAFDVTVFSELQNTIAPGGKVLLWHYPPTYPVLIYPLGLLEAPMALLIFSVLSLGIWVWTVWAVMPEERFGDRLVVLSGPAVYTCLAGGQNGTFVAALLVLFMVGLRQGKNWMTVLACVLLLAKPHFGVLLPIALIALWRWDIIWKTSVLGSAFIAFSIWVTGPEYTIAFLENWGTVTSAVAEQELLIVQTSLFALLVSFGMPAQIGFALQVVLAISLIVLTWIVFRGAIEDDLKYAFLFFATPLISPYAFQYDLVITLIGLFLFLRATQDAELSGKRILVVFVWAMPLLNAFIYNTLDVTLLFLPYGIMIIFILLRIGRRKADQMPHLG